MAEGRYNPETDRTEGPGGVELVKHSDTRSADSPLTLADVKAHIRIIQEVMREAMKEGVHYGRIPGTRGGPSLWKAGAELILATFRLGTEPSIEETGDGYRVSVRVFHVPSGKTIGYGMGSCSWGEEKYAWRAARPGEYEALEAQGRHEDQRIKYERNGTTKQVRTNPCDMQNTVLKMAVKRARVDACLTCTAASDVFDQDLEDLPRHQGAEGRNGNGGSSGEPPAVDDAKLLRAIEEAKNADELTVVFDAINELKSAKQKVSLMAAYRARFTELNPEVVK